MEIGVGRGVSPFELKHHKINHDESREIFVDAFDCINAGLTTDKLSYSGKHYAYSDVPIPLRPLQTPHPPFWYGSSNTTGSLWAGERGLHFVTNGATARAKDNIDAYKAALAKRGGPVAPKAEFPGGAAIGVSRQIIVADTEAEARRIAEPAFAHYHANLTYLWRLNVGDNLTVRNAVPIAATLDDAMREGTIIVGNPDTVADEINKQTAALGINYLLTYLLFGTMPLAAALRSLALFSGKVMPKISAT
jgi:alkanesulfonate monooxygenase SsuD/methylene tetrahydromethanopterin reductase-like flavin-dependent oxidoreductase (luciferase family)